MTARPALDFRALSPSDGPEIAGLLQETWPRLYGSSGCPDFTLCYLEWLYAGPSPDKNLLLGCYKGDRLIGFKAALHRRLRLNGAERHAHIASHLAIAPDLSLAERLEAAAELSGLHGLTGFPGWDSWGSDTLYLAFFEAEKPIVRNSERQARKNGIAVCQIPFRQAVVNPRRLKAAAGPDTGLRIRSADQSDVSTLSQLMAGQPHGCVWSPTDAELAHHLFAGPEAYVLIAERDGRPCGFVGGYVLRWQKGGAVTRFTIIEAVYHQDSATLNALLTKVEAMSRTLVSRGIIVENATYMSGEDLAAGGILLTPRNMTCMIRSQTPLNTAPESFRFDIK